MANRPKASWRWGFEPEAPASVRPIAAAGERRVDAGHVAIERATRAAHGGRGRPGVVDALKEVCRRRRGRTYERQGDDGGAVQRDAADSREVGQRGRTGGCPVDGQERIFDGGRAQSIIAVEERGDGAREGGD